MLLTRLSRAQKAEASRQIREELERRGVSRPDVAAAWTPHAPFIKQADYIAYDGLEAFYGGAVGGGKSDSMLMDGLQFVGVPGFAALLLRRTYKELTLPGGLIPRSQSWLAGKGVKWDGDLFKWTFPSGAVVQFGYLDGPFDHLRYQSSAFQQIGFEELPQWKDDVQYRYLFSRLRRLKGSTVPIKMRANGNPDGPGLDWVKDRFVPDAYLDSDEDTRFSNYWEKDGRKFFPARLRDNPYIDADEYELALAQLDPITRSRLESGDWTASPIGRYVRKEWFKFVNEAPPLARWVRGWDTGASENGDHTAGVLVGVEGRRIYVKDISRGKWDIPTVRNEIIATAKRDGTCVPVAIESAHFALGIIQDLTKHSDFDAFPLLKIGIRGDKEQRARGWIARLGNGEVYLVRGAWNDDFIDECLRFTNEKHNTDDQIDAMSVAFEAVFRTYGGTHENTKPPKRGSLEERLPRRDDSDDDDRDGYDDD